MATRINDDSFPLDRVLQDQGNQLINATWRQEPVAAIIEDERFDSLSNGHVIESRFVVQQIAFRQILLQHVGLCGTESPYPPASQFCEQPPRIAIQLHSQLADFVDIPCN